jgi:hypothetical protein
MERCGEQTRKMVAALRREQRRMWLGYVAVVVLAFTALSGVAALANTGAPGHVPSRQADCLATEPGDEIDVVGYHLPADESLSALTRRFWGREIRARELLCFNPTLRSVDELLPAGTSIQVPNFRDFPVEELAANSTGSI